MERRLAFKMPNMMNKGTNTDNMTRDWKYNMTDHILTIVKGVHSGMVCKIRVLVMVTSKTHMHMKINTG